ncbi:MAG: alpha/beta fold hydrolase [Corynebacterium sp.]|uniref:alpha/beta fold hydrolase n=1 Tax=Corynebacterium sp. TaxID=1720 RepID=UPI0026DF1138|nr:alpha/beta fold hydrolase [Corynebacterium sp.]MDO5670417.1 alpha/beta fold hydrolase [Corynebacterium sp.]
MSWLRWVPHRGTLPPLPERPGTPVLLLHGLMGSPGNFERTAAALVTAGAPVVAPLYGQRGTVTVDDSLQELIDVCRTLPTPFDIVGHSLGGLLGLRLAHEFEVRTLVGVGACFRGLPLPRPALRRAIPLVMGRGAGDLMSAEPFPAKIPEGTRVVSLISDADTIVPAWSGELGEVRHLSGVRHEHLPAQADAILDALEWTP